MDCGNGAISPVTFIISLFNSKVQMYEVHNNGGGTTLDSYWASVLHLEEALVEQHDGEGTDKQKMENLTNRWSSPRKKR